MGAASVYSEPVCVVICPSGISEEDVRWCLGDALPLKFAQWADHQYMEAIRSLRPRVIVVAAAQQHAADSAALLKSLLASAAPTIATLSLAEGRLRIWQLGANAQATIRSLDDLLLE